MPFVFPPPKLTYVTWKGKIQMFLKKAKWTLEQVMYAHQMQLSYTEANYWHYFKACFRKGNQWTFWKVQINTVRKGYQYNTKLMYMN